MVKTGKDYYEMFRKAKDFDTKRFDDYQELAAFYEGQQYLLTEYQLDKPWIIDLNTPYASDAIDIRVASLQANDYVGELEPLSPMDVETVDKLNSAYHNFWNEMQMDDKINESLERAAVLREAYIHVVYDDERAVGGTNTSRIGVLKPYFIDPSAVLIDPTANSFKDADYIIVTERITDRRIKRMYPDFFDDFGTSSDPMTEEDRGEIFLGNDYSMNQDGVWTKWTVYEKVDDDAVEKTVLIGTKIVEDTEDFPIGVYPIAQLRWQRKIKSPYGLGLMDRLIALQKSVNSIESAITNIALQSAVPSLWLSKNAGVDAEDLASVIGAPGLVIPVNGDPNTAYAVMSNNVINRDIIEVKRDNERTIYQIAGATDQFMGDIGTAGNTKSGTQDAISRAKGIEQKIITNIEEFIQDLSEIICKFIVNVFGGETIYTKGQKKTDGSYNFGSMQVPENANDVKFNFYINLNIKTPYSKENTKRLMQELFQMEMQYDAPVKTVNILDILKQFDVPNRDELIERYKNLIQKDEETKAQVIAQWTAVTEKNGIDLNLITQGIIEIMQGKETPTVDQVMATIEQQVQQQEQMQQQMQQQAMQQQYQLQNQMLDQQFKQANQPLTGDEEFNLGGGESQTEMTGDEEFSAEASEPSL